MTVHPDNETLQSAPDASSDDSLRRTHFFALAAALLFSFVLYSPRLRDFFLSDDFGFLWACVRPEGFFANSGWLSGNVAAWPSLFRFMPGYSLSGFVIHLFSGLDPLGWHVANFGLHFVNAVLVGVLVSRFVRSRWTAVGAAALFAVHFIHVEAVVWISARTTLLVTSFMLAAIVVETRPRVKTWGPARWLGLFLALLAYLSKEDSAVLPFLLWLVPSAPMTVSDSLRRPPRWMRAEFTELRSRLRVLWPYWLMGGVYLLTRFGAISQATQETAYRIEINLNIIKNALFVCVANLFPLDFRTALENWNRWYKSGEWSALPDFLMAHPGMIVGVLVASGFWLAVLLFGNRVARRLAVVTFVAAGPILLFRGTGERLVYLSSVASTGVLASILAGWHGAFREALGRAGRFVAPAILFILLGLHAGWLRHKAADWESASLLSRTITDSVRALAQDLPRNSTIQLSGLPDNVKGAWVYRTSIEYAFAVYSGRPDVKVIPASEAAVTAADSIRCYRWDGIRFVPTN